MRILKLCAALVISLLPAVATAGSSAAGKPILPAAEVAVFADRVQNDLSTRCQRCDCFAHGSRSCADA